ncbi:unnamed protein product, partial [Ectocarpus fasciculatus]
LTDVIAKVSEGRQRTGHGLRVCLSAKLSHTAVSREKYVHMGSLHLDIYGPKVFQCLPYGVGYVAPSFLPLTVYLENQRFSEPTGRFSAEFTIAGHQLSRGRADEVLNSIKHNGDDPFVLELRTQSDEVVGYFPTNASLIADSLASGSGKDVRYMGPLPHFKRKSTIYAWMKWIKCAVLLCGLCWMLLLAPGPVLSHTPRAPVGSRIDASNMTSTTLPLCAHNMTSAFKLGQLHTQLLQLNYSSKDMDPDVAAILRIAERTVGRPTNTVTVSDLLNSYMEIDKVERSVSMITRVRGFFTLINIIWFLAICGIAAAVLPCLYHVLYPFRKFWLDIVQCIANEILLPTAIKLHSYGIFELVGYLICFVFIAEGFRMPVFTGHYMSLTGAVLSLPAAAYSTAVWGLPLVKKITGVCLLQMHCVWLAACWTPLAIHFSSPLLGFGVVLALYIALGFSGGVGRLCMFIGFRGHKETLRVFITSLVIVCLLIVAKVCNYIPLFLWVPFSCALSTMGSNMLFLSLLILCEGGSSRENNLRLTFNVVMIVLLVVFMGLGLILEFDSLSNTAITYLVIWLLQRVVVFHFENNIYPWFLVLFLSMSMWKISLYLHQHPQHIVSIFSIM